MQEVQIMVKTRRNCAIRAIFSRNLEVELSLPAKQNSRHGLERRSRSNSNSDRVRWSNQTKPNQMNWTGLSRKINPTCSHACLFMDFKIYTYRPTQAPPPPLSYTSRSVIPGTFSPPPIQPAAPSRCVILALHRARDVVSQYVEGTA